jgi:uncharacterized tellurite resistance protein B-like protein
MVIQDKMGENFNDDEIIIENHLQFKSALGIGEKAYKTLRVRQNLSTFTEAFGLGTTLAGAANTTAIGGILGLKSAGIFGTGLFASAIAPGPTVIFAVGILSAGAYVGISKLLTKDKNDKLIITPKFIDTPLDLLATGLANFFIPIGLKIALTDQYLHEMEKIQIKNFMVKEWGYSEIFISKLIEVHLAAEPSLNNEDLLAKFIEFIKTNPDCDIDEIKASLISSLRQVIEADGEIKQSEEMELQNIKNLLKC